MKFSMIGTGQCYPSLETQRQDWPGRQPCKFWVAAHTKIGKHVIQTNPEEEEPEREAWVPEEAEIRSSVPGD